jgi:hypothetical protein
MTAPQDFEFDAAYRGETVRLGLGVRPPWSLGGGPPWCTPLGQIQRYRGLTAASHNPNFPR